MKSGSLFRWHFDIHFRMAKSTEPRTQSHPMLLYTNRSFVRGRFYAIRCKKIFKVHMFLHLRSCFIFAHATNEPACRALITT